jgi:endogenous inhibitor of DNA gyrase (YacG/DUF329 family)
VSDYAELRIVDKKDIALHSALCYCGGMKTKPRKTMPCTHCGKPITRLECQTKPGSKPYCSQACLSAARRHGCAIVCEQCGKTVYRRYGEQDRSVREHAFCSRACYMLYRVLHMQPTVYPKQGSVHIHRIVAQEMAGRPLREGEVVHHIDGNPHNSEPSNLFLFKSQADHVAYHAQLGHMGRGKKR